MTPENESDPEYQFNYPSSLTSSLDPQFLFLPSCCMAFTYDTASSRQSNQPVVTPNIEPDSIYTYAYSGARMNNLDQDCLGMASRYPVTMYDAAPVDPIDPPIVVLIEAESQSADRLARTEKGQ
jgi:hypothetical protein